MAQVFEKSNNKYGTSTKNEPKFETALVMQGLPIYELQDVTRVEE